MQEQHQHEQYFFSRSTVKHLADFIAAHYSRVACLCTPTLGQALAERGATVTILDLDTRFAHVTGFRYYNLLQPVWLEQTFDLIICDPPFFNVSLHQLRQVMSMLSHYNNHQPILLSYLTRRGHKVISVFESFGLKSTGYFPHYQTVQPITRNEIEFFGNLEPHFYAQLTQISGLATA